MESRELRIGNLFYPVNDINLPKEVPFIVYSIGISLNGIKYNQSLNTIKKPFTFKFSDVAGIPLTEEWLKRAGFKFDEDDMIYPHLPILGELRYAKIEKDSEKICLKDGDDSRIGIELKFVHQLQNLYFALTGTELEINI